MQKTGMAPTRFGELAVGDPNLVRDLSAGRELRSATARRIVDFILTGEPRNSKGAAQ